MLWPFFPGGIFEARYLQPIALVGDPDWRGSLVLGAYSDFAQLVVRDASDGKVLQYVNVRAGAASERPLYGARADVGAGRRR